MIEDVVEHGDQGRERQQMAATGHERVSERTKRRKSGKNETSSGMMSRREGDEEEGERG